MLTACCQHKQKIGRPYLHNKDIIVQHLRLLFKQIPEVVIDDYGSIRDWFCEASHEQYWKQFINCLLDTSAPTPTLPTTWPPPRQCSPCNHASNSSTQESDESDRHQHQSLENDSDSPPVPSPPRPAPPPIQDRLQP